MPWFGDVMVTEAAPGIWNTLVLTQIALVATGLIALLTFPLISSHFGGPARRTGGHIFLVIARSTPEYILAYILLQLWGPSMLPAVIALALHNGGIIGHLIGRQSSAIQLRPDAVIGFNRYTYELVPRVYRAFLAFLFYRWKSSCGKPQFWAFWGSTPSASMLTAPSKTSSSTGPWC